MNERERKILEMQAPSTRKCLERSPDLDFEWLNRKIPKEAQVVKEDGSVDLNLRKFSAEEKTFYNAEYGTSKIYGRHRERGAWVEEKRTQHLQSQNLSEKLKDKLETNHVMPTPAEKEIAIEAFMKAGKNIKAKFLALMQGVKETVKFGIARKHEE